MVPLECSLHLIKHLTFAGQTLNIDTKRSTVAING